MGEWWAAAAGVARRVLAPAARHATRSIRKYPGGHERATILVGDTSLDPRPRPSTPPSRPLVSIALPVKNGLPHVQDAIEGFRRQTYHNLELVVQDGASTDGSLEYLRSLSLPFPLLLVSAHDASLVAGYNRTLGRCTGDLIVFAACDEVLDDDAIERYVSWYDEHPQAIFIYGGSRIVAPSGVVTEFQPLAFDLIDYLRHLMCPTTAGAFNRRALGSELRFDESLRTVPDFELLTRVALRFGQHRIVCKRAITMTARGDAASMTFRPEALSQFARDKRVVIGRLLHGPLRAEFLDYVRRDLLSNMHAQFAERRYELAGDNPAFRREVLTAFVEMPGQPRAVRMAGMSRHFRWDEREGMLTVRKNVPPIPPPVGETSVALQVPVTAIRSEPHWIAAGAAVAAGRAGVRVRTPEVPWHYTATVQIDVGAFNLRAAWYWLKVTVADVAGSPMLSLFDPAANRLQQETTPVEGLQERDLFFELHDPVYTALLLRNGGAAQASSLEVHAVEVLTMPIRSSVALQVPVAAMRSEPHWIAAGAAVAAGRTGVCVRTPAVPWHYTATVQIDVGAFDLRAARYWLKVTVADVAGSPILSLFDPAANRLEAETTPVEGLQERDLFFELHDPVYTALLLRNGGAAQASSLEVRAIEVRTMRIRSDLSVDDSWLASVKGLRRAVMGETA